MFTHSWFSNCVCSLRDTRRRAARHARGSRCARPTLPLPPYAWHGIEWLEPRLPLAASVMDGLLNITGSPFADDIALAAGPNTGDVALFGVPGVQDGTLFRDIRAVKVDALAGDDRVRIGPIDLTPPSPNQDPAPCA
jgi:hypothetical protein